jgi:hypothetical protein
MEDEFLQFKSDLAVMNGRISAKVVDNGSIF